MGSGTKTHYTILEAAIRLSGLFAQETVIQERLGNSHWPNTQECADWPVLYLYLGRIQDALLHNDLACYKAGVAYRNGPFAHNDPLQNIRHVDLRKWIELDYPNEAHNFLFGANYVQQTVSERTTQVLCTELRAKEVELARCNQSLLAIQEKYESLVEENELHPEKSTNDPRKREASNRRRNGTLLGIIDALSTLLIEGSISRQQHLPFRTKESLIRTLLKHYPNRRGMSERNLHATLSEAKKAFDKAS